VFGAPAALGALTAVASASALDSNTGLALGALVAGIGTLLAGYYVTAGFDRGLVAAIQAEKLEQSAAADAQRLVQALWTAHPDINPILERVLVTHAAIDAVFHDGIDDSVERILEASRGDLRSLRDRAVKMVELYRRLTEVIQQSDGLRLFKEMNRLKAEVERLPRGPGRKAEEEALASAERTYNQWHGAVEKQKQVKSVLTVIEKNLEEFKIAMALRKAAALDGESGDGTSNVSELQARLAAAGEACDELVGRPSEPGRARRARV
jgi:hypothetical protein